MPKLRALLLLRDRRIRNFHDERQCSNRNCNPDGATDDEWKAKTEGGDHTTEKGADRHQPPHDRPSRAVDSAIEVIGYQYLVGRHQEDVPDRACKASQGGSQREVVDVRHESRDQDQDCSEHDRSRQGLSASEPGRESVRAQPTSDATYGRNGEDGTELSRVKS